MHSLQSHGRFNHQKRHSQTILEGGHEKIMQTKGLVASPPPNLHGDEEENLDMVEEKGGTKEG